MEREIHLTVAPEHPNTRTPEHLNTLEGESDKETRRAGDKVREFSCEL